MSAARPLGILAALAIFAGCPESKPPETTGAVEPVDDSDADGDGYAAIIDGGQDCDDENDDVHPGASEDCDGIDEDCDGEIDNGAILTWYTDEDGDGYGPDDSEASGCEAPEGAAEIGGDCDDSAPEIHPSAIELCNGIDDDCDEENVEAFLISGKDSFASLEDAIFEASAGDTIEVCDGVYTVETVLVDKEVIITSHSADASAVTLQGGAQGSILAISTGALTLRDLTLTGGRGSAIPGLYPNDPPAGGAVHALQGPLTVERCIFEENTADLGGAIAAIDATITDSTFRSNSAQGYYALGGAIYTPPSSALTIEGGLFEGNSAAFGAAALTSGTVSVTSTTFTGGAAVTSGGSFYVLGGDLTLADTEITANSAQYGAGLMIDGAFAVADEQTFISGNTASMQGGGLLIYGRGDASWTGGTFSGNTADFGGGILADRLNSADYAGSILISDVLLQDNLALLTPTSSGGGMYLWGSPIEASDIELIGNEAMLGGGASIDQTVPDQETALTRVSFVGNQAAQGGGMDLFEAEARLVDCSLSGNAATEGGGAIFLPAPGLLEIQGSTFGDDPEENTPDDLLSVNTQEMSLSLDFDGVINTRCTASTPECLNF